MVGYLAVVPNDVRSLTGSLAEVAKDIRALIGASVERVAQGAGCRWRLSTSRFKLGLGVRHNAVQIGPFALSWACPELVEGSKVS